jgi:hypothetical protein
MKKLVLHVGSGKAGSTSLQQALLENRLANQSLFTYPVLLNSAGNQILKHAFCDLSAAVDKVKEKFIGNERGYLTYQQEIKKSFIDECGDAATVVLSSEFWFRSSVDTVLSFKKLLQELHFSEIHVVMYLRDPAKFYLSFAQQMLKNTATLPCPNLFEYPMAVAIKNWKALEPVSFTVREFDRKQLVNEDVVQDFKHVLLTLGVPASLALEKPHNATLTAEATQAIQDGQAYLCTLDDKVKAKKIKDSINKVITSGGNIGSKPILRDVFVRLIHQRFKNEMRYLSNEYGIFLSSTDAASEQEHVDWMEVTKFRDLVTHFDDKTFSTIRSNITNIES